MRILFRSSMDMFDSVSGEGARIPPVKGTVNCPWSDFAEDLAGIEDVKSSSLTSSVIRLLPWSKDTLGGGGKLMVVH